MEPRKGDVVDSRISLEAVRRDGDGFQWPEGRSPGGDLRATRTPPGLRAGKAGIRAGAGTWERHRPPCHSPGKGDRVTKGPGVTGPLPPARQPAADTRNRRRGPGLVDRAPSEGPERGRRRSARHRRPEDEAAKIHPEQVRNPTPPTAGLKVKPVETFSCKEDAKDFAPTRTMSTAGRGWIAGGASTRESTVAEPCAEQDLACLVSTPVHRRGTGEPDAETFASGCCARGRRLSGAFTKARRPYSFSLVPRSSYRARLTASVRLREKKQK